MSGHEAAVQLVVSEVPDRNRALVPFREDQDRQPTSVGAERQGPPKLTVRLERLPRLPRSYVPKLDAELAPVENGQGGAIRAEGDRLDRVAAEVQASPDRPGNRVPKVD